MDLISVGFTNYVAAGRVVAIANPASLPVKRLVRQAEEKGLVVDLTSGRKVKAVLGAGHQPRRAGGPPARDHRGARQPGRVPGPGRAPGGRTCLKPPRAYPRPRRSGRPAPARQPGLLIVLSGPSGVGKDVALNLMRAQGFSLQFVVTTTSRPPRPGEVEGRDYNFVSASASSR